MGNDALIRFVEAGRLRRNEPLPADEPPMPAAPYHWGLGWTQAPDRQELPPPLSLDDARVAIWQAMLDYVREPMPAHMLLIKAPPGVGKSFAAVRLAENQARQGQRTLYAGPRHDLFQSLRYMAELPHEWYEWLPRQLGHPETGLGETCVYTPEISAWMHRGHRGIEFCKQICGWEWIHNGCPYHLQRQRPEAIIYGMHQHVFVGHPLAKQFTLLIGDEYPINAALHPWTIPAEAVAPEHDPFDPAPASSFLAQIQRLALSGGRFEGRALLDALGGPDLVKQTLETLTIPLDGALLAPSITRPQEGARAPYNHLIPLVQLVLREADAALEGHDYLSRVIVAGGNLMLLLRRKVSPKLPRHVIWLDATGNERLYEAVFERPVKVVAPRVERVGKVYQVWDRANGKSSLLEDGEATAKAAQLKQLVAHIIERQHYQRVGVYTFKDLEANFMEYATGHFGAETGTNQFEGIDAMFIAGTPLPSLLDLQTIARMIFFERMKPFGAIWSAKPVHYGYEAGGQVAYRYLRGFWGDPDLQAVTWQAREARLIQAAERARLNLRRVDVWLLTNVALDELPPDELLSIREILDAPPGVDVYLWSKAREVAERCDDLNGQVTAADLMHHLGCNKRTAYKYIDLLIASAGWQEVKAASRGRGRTPRAAGKRRE
jgi:hypothetical protein